jgi:hypothetical protein
LVRTSRWLITRCRWTGLLGRLRRVLRLRNRGFCASWLRRPGAFDSQRTLVGDHSCFACGKLRKVPSWGGARRRRLCSSHFHELAAQRRHVVGPALQGERRAGAALSERVRRPPARDAALHRDWPGRRRRSRFALAGLRGNRGSQTYDQKKSSSNTHQTPPPSLESRWAAPGGPFRVPGNSSGPVFDRR